MPHFERGGPKFLRRSREKMADTSEGVTHAFLSEIPSQKCIVMFSVTPEVVAIVFEADA